MFGANPKHIALAILSSKKPEIEMGEDAEHQTSDDLPEGLEDAVRELFEDGYSEKDAKPLSTEERARLIKRAKAFRAAFTILELAPHDEADEDADH